MDRRRNTAGSRTQHPRARPLHCDCVISARIWFLDQGRAVISVSSSSRLIHDRHTLCRRPSEPLPPRCQSIRPRAQHGSILRHPVARVTQWTPPFSNFQSTNSKIRQDRHCPTSSIRIRFSVLLSDCCGTCHFPSHSSHKFAVVTGTKQLTGSSGPCLHTLNSLTLTFMWRFYFN